MAILKTLFIAMTDPQQVKLIDAEPEDDRRPNFYLAPLRTPLRLLWLLPH